MKGKKRIRLLLVLLCLLALTAFPVTANAAVKINKTSITLDKGKTYTLKVTGTKTKVQWSSNNKKIATVSSSGKVKAVKKGSCTITAKAGSKTYSCKVTVRQPVTSLKLNKTSLSLNKGNTHTLKVTVAPSNANNKTVAWISTNKKVATVSSKGVVTAKGAGTASIIVIAKDGSFENASCELTVSAPCAHTKKIIYEKTEATYTTPGYTGSTQCADCGKWLTKGKTIPVKTDYKTVSLTKDNWNQYFELVHSKPTYLEDAFGNTNDLNVLHYILLKPQYRDKIISQLCSGGIEVSYSTIKANCIWNEKNKSITLGETISFGSGGGTARLQSLPLTSLLLPESQYESIGNSSEFLLGFSLPDFATINSFTSETNCMIRNYVTEITEVIRIQGTLYFEP